MNNWCICWFFTHIFTRNFNFKGLTALRLYKTFGVKGLIWDDVVSYKISGGAVRDDMVVMVDKKVPVLGSFTSFMGGGICSP
jgi:hypothetical protein